jgi:hypothetical protein
VVGAIGDSRANPSAGAVFVIFFKRGTGTALPSVKKWRKVTTSKQPFVYSQTVESH